MLSVVIDSLISLLMLFADNCTETLYLSDGVLDIVAVLTISGWIMLIALEMKTLS